MEENKSQDLNLDIKNLSKPISVPPSKQNWLDSLLGNFGSGPGRIHISEREKINPPPLKDVTGNVSTPAKIAISDETKMADPKQAKSKEAETFFTEAKKENEADEESWLSPPTPKAKSPVAPVGPTSISWLIGGALTLLIIVVIVLASFSLINFVRQSYDDQSLGDIDQAIEQASEFYNKQEYEPAKYKIEEVLQSDANNQAALELLDKINLKRGEIILNQFLLYKEVDLTMTSEQTYVDPQGHFSVYQDPAWTKLDTDYDAKFSDQAATYGVKKYPGVNSLKKLAEIYATNNQDQSNTVLTSKDNISFQDNNSQVIVSENKNYYIVSILMNKYYFGYEISGWLPKTNTTNSLINMEKFAQSFRLLPDFGVLNYDKLPTFDIDYNTFHYWPEKIDAARQSHISNQFVASISLINQTLLTNWSDHLDIYLYPDFTTLYTYTLSTNSFSDYNQKQIHLVYENQDTHQSFGYETAKVIFQNTFGAVKERYLLEGAAVMLDQTGRDYLAILRLNPFIPLSELSSVNWQIKSGDIKYFEAGVFTKYLIDKYGVDQYINLTQEAQFPEAYQKIYDRTLDEIETDMKAELGLN